MEVKVKPNNMRKRKIVIWTVVSLLVFIYLIVLGSNIFLARSLPKTSGELKLSSLIEPVSVVRDSMGVPHIQAENEHDLYLAQGFIQAQDRMFQMDLSRRQASGRLSEVIGEATVERDKYFRALGLRRAAEASFSQYSEQGKDTLNWFAEGVNLYMEQAKKSNKLPIEFTILGYQPEEWDAVDSLTIGKYMAFDLGGHWEDQAFRQYLLQKFPKEKAYDLFPSYPKDAPYIIGKNEIDLEKSLAKAVIPHEFNGSNNWVVAGEKTKSGKPLLADDPHLSLGTPSIWYQMHLEAPTVNVSGVIFAGIPGIILGHNESIAWGVTNTGPDVQDLYIEKRNPDHQDEFLYMDKWEKAKVIKEPIKVKKGKTIDYEVTETRHGPIISEFAGETGKEFVLSLQWTALEPSSELEAVLEMNKAKNWDEFEKALEDFHTPTQNFVFASNDGTIAYKANGKIPIRKKGDGLLPVPGWTGEYDWIGYIPYNELPRIVNPKQGFISTANNKVISDEYPYHISHNWAQPYRQMRIQEFLKEKDSLTLKDMQALQMDQKNLQAQEFVPMLLSNLSGNLTEQQKLIVNNLKDWNYQDNKDMAEPLIFHLWMKNIKTNLFQGDIPDEMMGLFGGQKQAVDELLRRANEGNPGPWITEKGGLKEIVQISFEDTLKEIKSLFGDNMEDWKWGEFHQVQFTHPLSSVKPLNYLFNFDKNIPVGGSSVTVQAASFREDGIVNHGGSWRFVIDTSDLTSGYHLVGPGQSGHVLSKWYHNQMDDWAKGEYHLTSLKEKVGKKLILKP
ncbi:penicillin acylase family protein [Bacillus sp. CGMCC 1.16607]|uniref:penicillin acylase family protein n=1 Tax=Bacillus sp. CGMCC 1.16607 TaxID=3351842 RepID=UPI00363353E7